MIFMGFQWRSTHSSEFQGFQGRSGGVSEEFQRILQRVPGDFSDVPKCSNGFLEVSGGFWGGSGVVLKDVLVDASPISHETLKRLEILLKTHGATLKAYQIVHGN